jgi:hypothetical protein
VAPLEDPVTSEGVFVLSNSPQKTDEPTEHGVPCGHPAGSREKVEAIRLRYEKGLILWHPQDDKTILKQVPK